MEIYEGNNFFLKEKDQKGVQRSTSSQKGVQRSTFFSKFPKGVQRSQRSTPGTPVIEIKKYKIETDI